MSALYINALCELRYRVTGKRVNSAGDGYGLEIPVTYELVGVDKAVDWARKNIEKGIEIVNKKIKIRK